MTKKITLSAIDLEEAPDVDRTADAAQETHRHRSQDETEHYAQASQTVQWEEAKHVGGQPENAGHFAPKGEGGGGGKESRGGRAQPASSPEPANEPRALTLGGRAFEFLPHAGRLFFRLATGGPKKPAWVPAPPNHAKAILERLRAEQRLREGQPPAQSDRRQRGPATDPGTPTAAAEGFANYAVAAWCYPQHGRRHGPACWSLFSKWELG